jgi:chromate transporter
MGEVFWAALRLGVTSFGGPIAHLGYFERVYVRRLSWLTNREYAGLVALCQALPGPTSSQVGFLVGWHRAGFRGACAAWLGFTLPSALLMYAFAVLTPATGTPLGQSILHGLMLTAVAVVAQAVWSMARSLCPDWQRAAIALLSGLALLLFSAASMQLVVMLLGAVGGWFLCPSGTLAQLGAADPPRRSAAIASICYCVLLGALVALSLLDPHGPLGLAAIFYRAGALVFGGGHVVLPLLRQELVPQGWVSDEQFLAGYGVAQGVPGPLFTVAAYLGALAAPEHLSGLWATVGIVAIFLPGLLLATGGLSLLRLLMRFPAASAALAGVNASVVGILGAALYDPVWRGGVRDAIDAIIAAVAFALLQRWRFPPLTIAVFCVLISVVRHPHSL